MRLAGATVAALAITVISARAEPEWPFPAHTADFVAKCKSERVWCAAAVEDMHRRDAVMSAWRTRYCVPRSMSADARLDPIMAWLAQHPDDGAGTRERLLAASKTIWPCPPTRLIK